jgi:hypothetical protein
VVFGTMVFAMFAGFLLLVAQVHRADAGRAARQAALLAAVPRLPHHLPDPSLARCGGHARRYADYGADAGFTILHTISSAGAFLLGASTLPFLYNAYQSRKSARVDVDDPWGWGRSLEWATSSPPPPHNFDKLPRIRSEGRAFDLHHPDIALAEYPDSRAHNRNLLDAGTDTGRREHLRQHADDDIWGPPPTQRLRGTTASHPASFMAFDLLAVAGGDTRTQRWTTRRSRLEDIAGWIPPLQRPDRPILRQHRGHSPTAAVRLVDGELAALDELEVAACICIAESPSSPRT